MKTLSKRSPLFALFLLLAIFSISGCLPQKIQLVNNGDPATPVKKLSPLDEARNAAARGDFARAEVLAMRLESDGALNTKDQAEAARVLAVSAMQNKHPSVSISALDSWRRKAPGVDASREWQDLWCKALGALSAHDARTRANEVYQDSARAPLVRSIAGVFLAVRQWEDGELGQSMIALENIYTSAQNNKDKAAIEGRLAMQLAKASPTALALIAATPTPENQGKFPYSLILIDKLRRASDTAGLDALSRQISLADASLFKAAPTETTIAFQAISTGPLTSGSISGQPVVLALPHSGQYGSFTKKITEGAQIACNEMSAAGKPVSLIVIDTDKSDWVSRIEGLPANATVIGGPLRRNDYATAKLRGITSKRVMFTFLASLDGNDEGRVAWRFFSSARDQVDTLLAFTSRLGITSYASFYPQENFGQRMTALFKERATAQNASVLEGSYAPSDSGSWLGAVSELIGNRKEGNAFRAIFLPDSWKNTDVIIPTILYYNEARQVFLGTSLWEQNLSGNSYVSQENYALAVFPGAWNGVTPSSAAAKLQSAVKSSGSGQADMWTALGYDFARMSANLGLAEGWTPDSVNNALQSPPITWSLAPLHWSRDGHASQDMFLFTPKEGGFTPVNEAEFKSRYSAAWE